MAETLTSWVGRAAHHGTDAASTNTIESMIGICREHSKNVRRWRDGTMALRWCAAGIIEAGKQFRPVNGRLHLPRLHTALAASFTENVSAVGQDEDQNVA